MFRAENTLPRPRTLAAPRAGSHTAPLCLTHCPFRDTENRARAPWPRSQRPARPPAGIQPAPRRTNGLPGLAAPRTLPVGSDEGQHHGLLLAALEAIDRLDLQLGVLVREALSQQVHLKHRARPWPQHRPGGCHTCSTLRGPRAAEPPGTPGSPPGASQGGSSHDRPSRRQHDRPLDRRDPHMPDSPAWGLRAGGRSADHRPLKQGCFSHGRGRALSQAHGR